MKKQPNKKMILVLILVGIIILLVLIFFPRKSIAPTRVPKDSIKSATPTVDLSSLSWPKGQTVNTAILMYHHVGPLPSGADSIRRGLTVSPQNFAKQMQFLKDNNYNVITLERMYELVAQGKLPEKAVVLTFDDGYDDNFTYAWPELQNNGFHGTFFIITSMVGSADHMTTDQIVELAKGGNEMSSHTVHHLSLDTVSGVTLQRELTESRDYLEKLIGKTIITFCYPAGKFNAEVEGELTAAGYKIAVTTEPSKGSFSSDNPYEVPRYRINPDTNLEKLLK